MKNICFIAQLVLLQVVINLETPTDFEVFTVQYLISYQNAILNNNSAKTNEGICVVPERNNFY